MGAAVMALMVCGCTDDSAASETDLGETLFPGNHQSRAGAVVETGTSVRVILTTATDQVSGNSTKTGDEEWSSTARVKKNVQYFIHGYMPADAATGSTLEAQPSGIANGAILSLNGVDAVTQTDLSVIVGVQDLTNSTDAFDVRMGQFGYLGKDRGKNFAHLLMYRIQSSIHFELLIDNGYSQLRTIKLKKATLTAEQGNKCDIMVNMRANNSGSNPITTINYIPTEGTTDVDIFEDEEGVALSTDVPLTFNVNFVPILRNYLTLNVTYDVYDSKGNFIHSRTASNKLGSALPALLHGEQTTLTLTVRPTYLYVLSDPDLDNPTIGITN